MFSDLKREKEVKFDGRRENWIQFTIPFLMFIHSFLLFDDINLDIVKSAMVSLFALLVIRFFIFPKNGIITIGIRIKI